MKNINYKNLLISSTVITLNISVTLFFYFHLNTLPFFLSLFLLSLLNTILLTKQTKSSSIIYKLLKKQYYKTKFRILNNLDNKKGIKSFLISKTNKFYQKILFHLILLLKNSEDGYQVVREEVFDDRKLLASKVKTGKEDSTVINILNTLNKIKNKENVNIQELEKLNKFLLNCYKQKQQKFTRLSASTISLLIIATTTTSLISSLVLPKINNLKAATYGWVQTDWTGGEDESSLANHTDNQTGWTKIYSKNDSVDVSIEGELTLDSTFVAITDTTDDDFNATVKTNNSGGFYINNGTIQLKKQNGATCTTSGECLVGCTNNICDNWYTNSVCPGIAVYYQNSGYMTKSNAETTCSTIGGRLGAHTELECIFQNHTLFGNNFSNTRYLTSTNSGMYPATVEFPSLKFESYSYYASTYMVRCIKSI